MINGSDPYRIAALLAKKAEGTLPNEERRELLEWRDSSPGNERLYRLWENNGRLPGLFLEYDSIDTSKAEREGIRLIKIRNKKRLSRRIATAVAACAVITAGVVFTTDRTPAEDPHTVADAAPMVPVLILEDGTEVPIDEQFGIIKTGETNIHKGEHISLVYDRLAGNSIKEAVYHTVRVPRGTHADVLLSDGSRVWLNAGSELRFPAVFPEDRRSVELRGEACFDVAKQPDRPFSVALSHATVNVTGTEFNVADYDGRRIYATLVSGSIDFDPAGSDKAVTLRPNQRLAYDARSNSMDIETVNARSYTAWKDDVFLFDGELLADIAAELERWYDVDFKFESPELKNLRLSVHVSRNEELKTLLGLFEMGISVRFGISGRTITVKNP